MLVPRILAGRGPIRAAIEARLHAPTRRALTRRAVMIVNSGRSRVRRSGRADTPVGLTVGRRVVGAAMHRAVTVLIANLGGVGRARVMGAALARRPNANGWAADQMTGHRGPVAQTSLAAGDFRPRGVGSLAKRVEGPVRRIRVARLGAKTALAGSKPRPRSSTKAGESLVALWAKIRRRGRRRKATWRNAQKVHQLSTVRITIGPVLDFQSGEAALPRDPVIATAVVTKIDPAERAGDPMTGPIDRAIGQALAAPRGAVPGAAVSTAPGPPAWGAQAIGADRCRSGSRSCTSVHRGPSGSRQKINPRLRFVKRPGKQPTGSESPTRRLRLRSSRQLTIRLVSRRNLRQNCAERQTQFRKSCARPWECAAARGWNTS